MHGAPANHPRGGPQMSLPSVVRLSVRQEYIRRYSFAAHLMLSRPARRRISVPRPVLIAGLGVLLAAVLATALPGAYGAVKDGIAQIPDAKLEWIALAIGLEALSFLGHIVLFRAVFVDGDARVGYGASYEITMA